MPGSPTSGVEYPGRPRSPGAHEDQHKLGSEIADQASHEMVFCPAGRGGRCQHLKMWDLPGAVGVRELEICLQVASPKAMFASLSEVFVPSDWRS
jgi:hypothetical protein